MHQARHACCDRGSQPSNLHNSLAIHNNAHITRVRIMIRDDDLRARPGRVRDRRRGNVRRAKPFIAQALIAAGKAGGIHRRSGRRRGTAFGRGRAASVTAAQLMSDRTRHVAVKARVVRHGARGAPLRTHLAYLRRDGVTRDGSPGRMFDAERDDTDHRAFAERCEDGFSLVPWRPVIENQIGRRVMGIMRGGDASWQLGRVIGLGLCV
jgi:hypothetical protein